MTFENMKAPLEQNPMLAYVGCWIEAQSLMGVQPWLERPIADNLKKLKVAFTAEKGEVI